MADRQRFTYEHGGAILPKKSNPPPQESPQQNQTATEVHRIISESLANRSAQEEQTAAIVRQVMKPAAEVSDMPNNLSQPEKRSGEETRVQADSAVLNQPKATFDFEPTDQTSAEKAQQKAKETPAAPAQKKKTEEEPLEKKTKQKQTAKKKGRGWLIAAALVVLVLVAGAALHFTGVYTLDEALSLFAKPQIQYYTYTANSQEELVRYIKHPALKPGDTLELGGNFVVDVDLDFGGYAELPLINLTGSGSVNFVGGVVVLSGSGDTVDMSKASFNTKELYIEAPTVNLKLGSADDSNINVATLNGTAHTKELDVKLPGMVFSVPVTFTNESGSSLTDMEVHLTSTSFVFPDGNTVILPSIGAGQTVEMDIKVMATEAGRPYISAYAVDSSGNLLVSGISAFVDIQGGGYYGGDTHTHSVDSHSQHFSTTQENIEMAYERGLSYIYSIESRNPEVYYTAEEIEGLLGAANAFLQLKATEQTEHVNHMLIYDSDEMPPANYEPDYLGITYWYYQDAINQVVADGGFVILPHFFYASVETSQQQLARTARNLTAIEILTLQNTFEEIVTRVPFIVWDNHNVRGLSKVFGVFSSNNLSALQIGRQYIKGYLPALEEEYVSANLRNGNYYMTNGPELRFTLADKMMGQDIYMPRPLEEGETLPEGVMAPITTATAKIYAADTHPLTKVRLLKFFISGNIDAIEPEMLYEEDFTGKGVYEKWIEIPVEMEPDTYYRVEVYSEQPRYHEDDIGVALSNPIYCYQAGSGSVASLESVEMTKKSLEIQQAPNGTRYIVADKEIGTNYFRIKSNTPNYYVEYHQNSGSMADYVNIVMVTQNKTYVVERIYIYYTE